MLLIITSDFTLALCTSSLTVAVVEMKELKMFYCIMCNCVYFVFFCICMCDFVIQPFSCNINKVELS